MRHGRRRISVAALRRSRRSRRERRRTGADIGWKDSVKGAGRRRSRRGRVKRTATGGRARRPLAGIGRCPLARAVPATVPVAGIGWVAARIPPGRLPPSRAPAQVRIGGETGAHDIRPPRSAVVYPIRLSVILRRTARPANRACAESPCTPTDRPRPLPGTRRHEAGTASIQPRSPRRRRRAGDLPRRGQRVLRPAGQGARAPGAGDRRRPRRGGRRRGMDHRPPASG